MWSFRLSCAIPIKAAFVTHCWLICLIWHLQQWVVSFASFFFFFNKLNKKGGTKHEVVGMQRSCLQEAKGIILQPLTRCSLTVNINYGGEFTSAGTRTGQETLPAPFPCLPQWFWGLWSSCSSGQGSFPGYLCAFIVPTSVQPGGNRNCSG